MLKVCNFLHIRDDDSLFNLEGADRAAIYQGQHYSYIRGNKIVREPRPDKVDPALGDKIARYAARWRQLYGMGWPPYLKHHEGEVWLLDRISRVSDAALYHMFSTRKRLTRGAFPFVPISVLRRCREMKHSRPNSVDQPSKFDSASKAAVRESLPARGERSLS